MEEIISPVSAPEWLLKCMSAPKASSSPATSSGDAATGKIGDGARNAALASMAGVMRRKGMSESSIMAALAQENTARCSPPLPDSEVHKIAHSITRYPPASVPAETGQPGWDMPIPFHNPKLPEFPTHTLLDWLRRFVEGIAEATQTPLSLAGMLVLAICACICAKKFIVKICSGWIEPVNLFLAVVLWPGNRKSAVFSKVEKPLREYEEAAVLSMAEEIAAAETRHRILLGKVQKAQAKASACDGPEAEQLTKTATELAKEASGMKIPAVPRFVADDVTPERLATLLKEQDSHMAVLSAECGIFELMAGRYSDGAANLDVYLKGHAGDTLRVDRVGRPPEYVSHPALTIGLAVQPEVLAGLVSKQGFRGRGLLGRFLYSLPLNLLGRRKIGAQPLSDEISKEYYRNICKLLELPLDKDEERQIQSHVLRFSNDALEKFRKFEAWIEPRLAEFGLLGHMTDWAGKLAGAVARIAGLLHLAEHSGEAAPWNTQISLATVEKAICLGEYFIPHAQAAYAAMGADPAIEDAKRVLEWIRKEGCPEFTKRNAYQSLKGYFKQVAQLEPALAILCEHGYIRLRAGDARPGAGRKPSPVYEVNPIWLTKSGDSDPQKSDSEDCGNCEDTGGTIHAPPQEATQGNSEDSEDEYINTHFDQSISILSNDSPASQVASEAPIGSPVAPQNSQNPQNCAKSPEETSLFNADELGLLADASQEDLAGLTNLKTAFPGCIIRSVEPSPAEEPVSEAERKAMEMDAHLKDVCRRRNLVFADIERLWPAIEKRRRQQKKEERENGKEKNEKPGW